MPSDSGSLLDDTPGGNRKPPWERGGFAVVVLERRCWVARVDGRRCGLPLRRAMGRSPLTTHVKSPGSHLPESVKYLPLVVKGETGMCARVLHARWALARRLALPSRQQFGFGVAGDDAVVYAVSSDGNT